MPRKTATIIIHNVYGTRSTVFSGVYYRAKRLWYKMVTVQLMQFEKAKTWAFSNGFSRSD